MSITPELQAKAEKCGLLLAKSFLAQDIKDAVLEALEKATEKDLDVLIASLEKEQEEIVKLGEQFKEAEKENTEKWENIKKAQEQLAQSAVDDFLAQIVRENMNKA